MKRLILLASVAALFAGAVPAAANAEMVHDEEGNPVNFMTAVSTNTEVALVGYAIECTTFDLAITFTKNEEGFASGAGVGTATGRPFLGTHSGECTTGAGIPINITEITVEQFDLESPFGDGSIELTYDITNPIGEPTMCTLAGTFLIPFTAGESVFDIVSGSLEGKENLLKCGKSGGILGEFSATGPLAETLFIG